MADNPIGRALSDPKARTLLIVVGIIVVVLISIALSRIKEATQGPSTTAKSVVRSAPTGRMDSTPGNPNAPEEYKRLQVIENKIRLETAEETGKSAIPTIIRNKADDNADLGSLQTGDRAGREAKAGNVKEKGEGNNNAQSDLMKLYQQQQANQLKQNLERERSLAKEREEQANAQRQAAYEALMKTQVSALFNHWVPPHQVYVSGGDGGKEGGANAGNVSGGAASAAGAATQNQEAGRIFAKSGDIFYAVLETGVNSDTPSPVMARIVSGPFKGAKAIGSMTRENDRLLLRFSTLNIDGMPRSIGLNAVAIDTDTAHTALASDVDHHYLLKYGTLFASSFLSGVSSTLQGATTNCFFGVCSTSGGGTTLSNLSNGEKILYSGLGQVGTRLSQDTDLSNIPPTVTLDSGMGVGLLLLADLSTEVPPQPPETGKMVTTAAVQTGAQTLGGGTGQLSQGGSAGQGNNNAAFANLGIATAQLAQSLSSIPGLGVTQNTNTAQTNNK